MKDKKSQICVICKNEITAGLNDPYAYGHSADPIAKGMCCDNCHPNVLVERLRQRYA
tara:strand:- start:827 stop:997 length:171 start_codon:yes stop_codon:yes gene_type:complete